MRTHLFTRPTCNTPRTICSAFPISSYFYTVLRANILALPTSGAEFFIKCNLWIRTDGLRIAAPRAMQITSLQKYIGSDSFSIMYMEMFYDYIDMGALADIDEQDLKCIEETVKKIEDNMQKIIRGEKGL